MQPGCLLARPWTTVSGCWGAFFVANAGTLEHSTIVISPPYSAWRVPA